MAKRVIVIWSMLYVCCPSCLAVITNVVQCVNVELTTSILNEFPNMDNSTPHSVVLGFLKGMITGDYQLYLCPLSDDLRKDDSGTSDLSIVSQSKINQFHDFSIAQGFSNHVVRSFSQVSSNRVVTAHLLMSSRCGALYKTNDLSVVMETFNGNWRITQWDVDE